MNMNRRKPVRWAIARSALHCAPKTGRYALCGADLIEPELEITTYADCSPETVLCAACRRALRIIDRVREHTGLRGVLICALFAGEIHMIRPSAPDRPWLVCGADAEDSNRSSGTFDARIVLRFETAEGSVFVDAEGNSVDHPVLCAACRRPPVADQVTPIVE